MSYNHTEVEKVIAQHDHYTSVAAKYAEGYNNEEFKKEFVLNDGVYVERHLLSFCREVQHVFRGARFLTSNDCHSRYVGGVSGFTQVHIVMPNQPYTLGKLGYGNYTENDRADPTYMVCSRKIKNEKYRANNDNYNCVMSKDLARAVVNVKKFVRQYTAAEMAPIALRKFATSAKEAPEKVASAWRGARNTVRDSDRLYRELKALHEQGYQFLSDDFAQQVNAWVETAKAWSEEKARVVPATFVHVLPVRDQQYFDVVRAPNIREDSMITMKDTLLQGTAERFTQEDIPQDLLGKLSVLSLLSNNQYVEGVGMRVHETLYWVEGV